MLTRHAQHGGEPSSPDYSIQGIVITEQPYLVGSTPRLDLLGVALQKAGSDAGMVGTPGSRALTLNGLHGGWRLSPEEFPIINTYGQLGYRVGDGTSIYSAFLQRNGSKSLTGDLRMNGHSIQDAGVVNAQNVDSKKASFVDAVVTNLEVKDSASVGGSLGVSEYIGVGNGIATNELWATEYNNLNVFRTIEKVICHDSACTNTLPKDTCKQINTYTIANHQEQTWICQ